MASGMAFLSKMAKAPAAPSAKKGMPIIELPNTPEVRAAMKTWIEQKHTEATAESIRKMQEDVLRPLAADAREKYCIDKGYSASVKVMVKAEKEGEEDLVLQFSAPCKYSKIPADTEAKLKEIFGEELYNKYFRLVTNVALTDKAMKEIEQGGNLMERIVTAVGGPEAFQQYFEVEQFIEPLESFHMDRVQDKAVATKAKRAIEDKVIKPTTPSFKEP